MARAYGSSANLLMKRETAYGQSATGDYRCNLGSQQGLIDDPVLGRDPLAPLQDVINDEGDIMVSVDPRYLGLWLTGLFGDPNTTDTSMAAGTTSSPWAATTCRATRSRSACRRCRRSSYMPASSSLDRAGVHPIHRERTEAGLAPDGLPDLSAEGERDGFYQAQLIRELAVRHITGWTGVELEGGRASPTPENIAAVMELYPVGERFFQEFTLRQVLLNAAKNGSGLSAAGSSSPAEGPNIAKPAATTASPAPGADPEPTDSAAPTASTP